MNPSYANLYAVVLPGDASAAASPGAPMGIPAPPELILWPYLLQLVAVTAGLAAAAYFGLRYLRRRFPQFDVTRVLGLQSNTGLKVLDRVMVDPKHSVFVVSLGKRAWLLAATEQQVTTVAELTLDELGNDFANLVEKEVGHGTHS